MNQLSIDLNQYNAYKKDLKAIETTFEKDMPSAGTNAKNLDLFLAKTKRYLDKINSRVEEINSGNGYKNSVGSDPQISEGDKVSENLDMKSANEKIHEKIEENKEIVDSLLNSIVKIIKTFFDYSKSLTKMRTDSSALDKINRASEKYLREGLVNILKRNIDKFAPQCYNQKVDDLNKKISTLSDDLERLSPQEISKYASDIIEGLILRITSNYQSKDMEIGNLNEKIIYLLRELEGYKTKGKSQKLSDSEEIHV